MFFWILRPEVSGLWMTSVKNPPPDLSGSPFKKGEQKIPSAMLQNDKLLSVAGEKNLYKKSVFLVWIIYYICKHFIDFVCRRFSLFRWEVIYYSLVKNPLHIYVLSNFYDIISFYKLSKQKFN